jgi:hypothetical protein
MSAKGKPAGGALLCKQTCFRRPQATDYQETGQTACCGRSVRPSVQLSPGMTKLRRKQGDFRKINTGIKMAGERQMLNETCSFFHYVSNSVPRLFMKHSISAAENLTSLQ